MCPILSKSVNQFVEKNNMVVEFGPCVLDGTLAMPFEIRGEIRTNIYSEK